MSIYKSFCYHNILSYYISYTGLVQTVVNKKKFPFHKLIFIQNYDVDPHPYNIPLPNL